MPRKPMSENCPPILTEKTDMMRLAKGKLSGDFSAYAFPEKGTTKGMISLTGDFTLHVSEDKTGDRFVEKSTGHLKFSHQVLDYSKDSPLMGGWNISGEARLTGSRSAYRDRFSMVGQLKAEHTLYVIADGKQVVHNTNKGEQPVELIFTLEEAMCTNASGSFTCAFLDENINALTSQGFAAESAHASWHTTSGTLLAELLKLRGEIWQLRDKALGTDPKKRKSSVNQLGKLATKIGQLPDNRDRDCMMRIWYYDGVYPVISAWLEKELEYLRAFAGRYTQAEPHIREAMKIAKDFAGLRVDACSESKQRETFEAIQQALTKSFDWIIEHGAAPQDILRLEKSVDLLGQVSPALREKVWRALRVMAEKKCETIYKQVKAALRADPQAPVVRTWLELLRVATRQATAMRAYEDNPDRLSELNAFLLEMATRYPKPK